MDCKMRRNGLADKEQCKVSQLQGKLQATMKCDIMIDGAGLG